MNCRKVCVIFIIILLEHCKVTGQVNSDQRSIPPWSFGTRLYYGSLLRFSPSQPLIGLTSIQSLEIFASKKTYGNDQWSEYYKYPEIEFGFSAYHFDMYKEFGSMYSIGSTMKYHLFSRKKSSLTFAMGPAINYATTVYDAENNPVNMAIGAHWNIELRGNLNYQYQLNPKWMLSGSLAFRHMSNGAYQKPNYGQNFPMIGIGAVHTPQNKKVEFQNSELKYFKKRIRVSIKYNVGWKQAQVWLDSIDFITSITISASKRISEVYSLVIGLDGIYDNSTFHEYWTLYGVMGPNWRDSYVDDKKRAGLFGGIIFHFGNLSGYFNFGGYIYQPNQLRSNVYQKYGFTYHFYDHIFLHTALLAHSGVADHLQFGLGITI